eukprot:1227381-Prymnesium_polylepis.1
MRRRALAARTRAQRVRGGVGGVVRLPAVCDCGVLCGAYLAYCRQPTSLLNFPGRLRLYYPLVADVSSEYAKSSNAQKLKSSKELNHNLRSRC